MIRLHLSCFEFIAANPKDLLLGVAECRLSLREAGDFRLGDFIAIPQQIGADRYDLQRIQRVERVSLDDGN